MNGTSGGILPRASRSRLRLFVLAYIGTLASPHSVPAPPPFTSILAWHILSGGILPRASRSRLRLIDKLRRHLLQPRPCFHSSAFFLEVVAGTGRRALTLGGASSGPGGSGPPCPSGSSGASIWSSAAMCAGPLPHLLQLQRGFAACGSSAGGTFKAPAALGAGEPSGGWRVGCGRCLANLKK